jgi:thioredoxin reductase (NADPH)
MAAAQAHDLVIIGGGPAGLTASIYATRALLDSVTVEQGAFGGQAAITYVIDNYPGSPNINGAELGMSMQGQAEALGSEFVYDDVSGVSFDQGDGTFLVTCEEEGEIACKAVILATGGSPRRAGFEGEERFSGHGVSYCATCDGMFYMGKEVFVIGGGNTACEEALFLTRFASSVTLIVRKDHVRAVASVAEKIEAEPKISIRYNTRIVSIDGDELPSSIVFEDTSTGQVLSESYSEGSFGIFVFVGRVPGSGLVGSLVELADDGTVITDERMATKTPGLFCAGDVRDKPLRQVITAASDGAIAATSAAQYLGRPAV